MKALIIDDEPLARLIVKEYLQQYPAVTSVRECGDGFEGLKAIQQERPDIIFLDIQMPKINGFEMLELLDESPPVVFTTAFDEYAIKAFEAHATDYLLKPFSKERFAKAMERVTLLSENVIPFLKTPSNSSQETSAEAEKVTPFLNSLLDTAAESPAQRNRIVVKIGSKIRIIPVKEIKFLEAADDYVKIKTPDGSFLKNKTMQHFENLLDPAIFVRTHRSYILNVQQVARIDVYEKDNHVAILHTGEQVPVSRNGYVKLRNVLDM